MNILYIANLIPYPLDGGGKIFTYSTLQALSKFHMIDMVCFYEHEDMAYIRGRCFNMIFLWKYYVNRRTNEISE